MNFDPKTILTPVEVSHLDASLIAKEFLSEFSVALDRLKSSENSCALFLRAKRFQVFSDEGKDIMQAFLFGMVRKLTLQKENEITPQEKYGKTRIEEKFDKTRLEKKE